jgi:hypothetical protein
MRLDSAYISGLKEYLSSGELKEDFMNSPEERRYEILDFLESLMELAEVADAAATKIIFREGYLEQLSGVKAQK